MMIKLYKINLQKLKEKKVNIRKYNLKYSKVLD